MNEFVRGGLYGGGIIVGIMSSLLFVLWAERKMAARMQSRIGPNIIDPTGFLQAMSDVLKLLQKEDIIPEKADRALFNLAPVFGAAAALAVAAVVPFSASIVGADLDVGVLYLLAVGAVSVLPVFAAGWGSNNKFALLGAMRAIAQSVSYEVPLVLAALVPVMLAGSMKVSDIVAWQASHHWLVVWPFFLGVPAFVLFMLAMLAESNRIPFDIPEAESELVAGITTEYSGMKFGLFYMTEYLHTVIASAVAASLFLGGFDGPGGPGIWWMVIKTFVLVVAIYWLRWSLLRFRSDQLMALCWRWLVPSGVVLVVATALWVVFAA
ncbi:MAG: NADH-quinone oxidoreductase subunit NuoH [Myxococcaceae bacterium]|nr:NADH-quinone oxidoreductase subunit NuoH [Myxococcaceae bacterium]